MPLFNALPSPETRWSGRSLAVFDVLPMLQALVAGGETLAAPRLPLSAPPAFLLDYDRADNPRPHATPACSITDR